MANPDLRLPRLPPGQRNVLYHFSEDSNIEVFWPRLSRPLPNYPEGRELVWVIDKYHALFYLFPRECLRVILWALDSSTQSDIDLDGWTRLSYGRVH